ncbi:MAG TPA: aspartate--tRNA ligase, partial [Firmicutes bacterium]|nr:aspartate--tRNA ligase [Bacillota bacterium]
PELFKTAETIRNEFVIMVKGRVEKRPEQMINTDLATGEVEVYAEDLLIINPAKTPPIYVDDRANVDETLRF